MAKWHEYSSPMDIAQVWFWPGAIHGLWWSLPSSEGFSLVLSVFPIHKNQVPIWSGERICMKSSECPSGFLSEYCLIFVQSLPSNIPSPKLSPNGCTCILFMVTVACSLLFKAIFKLLLHSKLLSFFAVIISLLESFCIALTILSSNRLDGTICKSKQRIQQLSQNIKL